MIDVNVVVVSVISLSLVVGILVSIKNRIDGL